MEEKSQEFTVWSPEVFIHGSVSNFTYQQSNYTIKLKALPFKEGRLIDAHSASAICELLKQHEPLNIIHFKVSAESVDIKERIQSTEQQAKVFENRGSSNGSVGRLFCRSIN